MKMCSSECGADGCFGPLPSDCVSCQHLQLSQTGYNCIIIVFFTPAVLCMSLILLILSYEFEAEATMYLLSFNRQV